MELSNYIDLGEICGISGLFFASGSFGIVDGGVKYTESHEDAITKIVFNNNEIEIRAEFTEYPNGVVIRRDYFTNLTKNAITLNRLVSRFRLKGNKYQAYTQFNGWQHESEGGWQNLVTEVAVASRGIRTCDGATPMLALCDEYSGRSTVFHLLPNCQWKMSAKKMPIYNSYETIVVEMGFNDEGLCMEVESGEEIVLPPVIFYQAAYKTDLDAYKLHEVYNQLYPRKRTPVLYNSWLYCFDYLDIEALLEQVDAAADLGIEAFMIDAGWFGDGEGWSERVGDWTENTTGGPKGRLIEIANRVREKGMIFGLWFEPERAGSLSNALKEHSEYYIDGKFFDFTDPQAREYMIKSISSQIEKYGIGWLKFDFNDTIPYDKTGCAFYRYLQGQKQFVEALKDKYPDIYITNCASGGYRMELGQGAFTDSFWLSDNQGPYEGLRIVKDTIKRMPSALIERWCVQKYCEGFLQYGQQEKVGRMVYCNNGTWDHLINVNDGYAKAFMTGGPIGFSCDIANLPERYKEFWKTAIAEFKEERSLYANGTARILVDSNDLVVIEYADKAFEKCIVQIFTKNSHLTDLIVYPCVNEGAEYSYNGQILSGKSIQKNGITISSNIGDNNCLIIHLYAKRMV